MSYRCQASSVAGFIQQLAVAYVANGYFRYVVGEIPSRKDPLAIDRKLIQQFGVVGKSARHRRKVAGLANVQYIRYRNFFVLLVSEYGHHDRFEREGEMIRDVRNVPIKFAGHSISYGGGHVRVRIEAALYLRLKAFFVDNALRWPKASLEKRLGRLRFEAFAPVRGQLLCILRAVNRRRKLAGLDLAEPSCLSLYRRFPESPLVEGQATLPQAIGRTRRPALLLPRALMDTSDDGTN